tara:strand:+ start:320 stop:907 length:588 start_codon:yes stop_codon:yes gene_type:complete
MSINIEIGGQRTMDGWQNLGTRDNGFNILTHEIPADDGTVDMLYWSHVIEHLPACHLYDILKRMHTKLKPGGLLRTLCPDLKKICEAYLNNDEEAFNRESSQNHWSSIDDHHKTMGIGGMFLAQVSYAQKTLRDENINILQDGTYCASFSHVAAYDFDMLSRALKHVGFSKVEESEIQAIDQHKEGGQLVVNAYK